MTNPLTSRQMFQASVALMQARDRLLALDPTIVNDSKLFTDMLEGEAAGDPFAVIDGLIQQSLDDGSMIDAIEAREKELAARKWRLEARKEALRTSVQRLMEALELMTIERAEYSASITAGQASVRLTVDDVRKLEPRFQRVTADKIALRRALDAGEEDIGAALSNGPPYLTVRTR